MIFYGRRMTAQLELTKPLDCCCNCGIDSDDVLLVDTPLRQTRFFLVYGTELTLLDAFPYCRECRPSAARVRPGVLAKLLMAALTTASLFFVIVMAESVLPRTMQASPFRWSLALALVATYLYFALRGRRGSPRSYYQPVRLVDAHVGDSRLYGVRLEFANATYRELFERANADRIGAGQLQVQAAA